MNESEKRRERLLRDTRSQYSSRRGTPAVHPRYRAMYQNLYGRGEDDRMTGSTLGMRIFICLILFGIFAAADYREEKIWKYSPAQIISEIGSQPDFSSLGDQLLNH